MLKNTGNIRVGPKYSNSLNKKWEKKTGKKLIKYVTNKTFYIFQKLLK